MQVLITSHEFVRLRGVPIFAQLTAQALITRGHGVTIYSPFIAGVLADRAREAGIALARDLGSMAGSSLDVALVNGSYVNACEVRRHLPAVPMVFAYHAAAGMPNRPLIDLGMAARIALSEEIRDAVLEGEPGVSIEVLRSPVDTDRLRPAAAVSPRPRAALIYSGKFTPAQVEAMRDACEVSGVEVRHVLVGDTEVFEIEALMNDVDLVFTRGRGAIEAMACGRVVIVPGDGMITAANIDEIQATHFSGRRFRIPQTRDWFVSEIAKFDPAVGDDNARFARERYGASRHAARLESLLHDATRVPSPRPLASVDGQQRLLAFVADVARARAEAPSMADALRRQEMLLNVHRSAHPRLMRRLYNGRLWIDRLVPWSSWVRLNQRLLPVDNPWRRTLRSMRHSVWKWLSS